MAGPSIMTTIQWLHIVVFIFNQNIFSDILVLNKIGIYKRAFLLLLSIYYWYVCECSICKMLAFKRSCTSDPVLELNFECLPNIFVQINTCQNKLIPVCIRVSIKLQFDRLKYISLSIAYCIM